MTRQPMSRVDHAWLRMDSPHNLLMVNSVLWTDRPIDDAQLRDLLRHRMVGEFPRFSQRPDSAASPFGRGHWVDDEDFDLDRHLVYVELEPPGDAEALQLYVGDQQHVTLDPMHPLWQVHILSGYGAGSAVVFRFHHAIADGMALARLLVSLTDRDPAAHFAPPAAPHSGSARRAVGRLLSETMHVASHPSRLLALGSTAAHDVARLAIIADKPVKPTSVLNDEVGMSKLATWSRPFSLDEVKEIGRSSDCTVNDVLLAALGGAFRRYLVHRGEEPVDVPVLVPVDLRPPDEPLPRELGNSFGFFFVDLPAGQAEAAERLASAHRQAAALKSSPEAVVTLGVLAGMGAATGLVEDFSVAFFASKVSGVVTNVPGPREPVYFAGAKVDGIIGWVPRGGDMTFGIAIFSYAGTVTVGVSTDEASIPDPEVLVEAFEDEVRALVGAAVQPD